MSILARIKTSIGGTAAGYRVLRGRGRPSAPLERPQRAAFELQLPNPFGGEPWCRASVAVTAIHHAQGESLRLQAHVDSCLRMPASPPERAALPSPDSDARGLVARGRRAGGGLLRYGLQRLPMQRLAPLLQRRLQTWVDVQASSTPLAEGVEALVPERLREMCRDLPQRVPGQPRLATWLGEIGGTRPGMAQLTTLQLDESDLPAGYHRRPFNLSASVATCVQDESAAPDADARDR